MLKKRSARKMKPRRQGCRQSAKLTNKKSWLSEKLSKRSERKESGKIK